MVKLSSEQKIKSNDGAILVIDSGIGGVSILNALAIKLPKEHFIYFADYAFLPYGVKTSEEIKRRCLSLVESYRDIKIKAVVLACNSATAAAISTLRELHELEFFGTEPGLKPASQKSVLGIAVLATQLTLNSDQFNKLTKQYAAGLPLYCLPAPDLVSLVESGHWNDDHSKEVISDMLENISMPFDVLLLGCTHFCFLKEQLKDILGSAVNILDTSDAIAERVVCKLEEVGLLKIHVKANAKTELVLNYSQAALFNPHDLSSKQELATKLALLKSSVHSSFHIIKTQEHAFKG